MEELELPPTRARCIIRPVYWLAFFFNFKLTAPVRPKSRMSILVFSIGKELAIWVANLVNAAKHLLGLSRSAIVGKFVV